MSSPSHSQSLQSDASLPDVQNPEEPLFVDSRTLDPSDSQNPENSNPHSPQNPVVEDTPQEEIMLDREESEQHESGMNFSSSDTPTVAVADTPDAPLPSPSNPHKRPANTKRKKPVSKQKQQAIEKKIQTLMVNLNPIPFKPTKSLDFSQHEACLRQIGLWDLVHIQFDQSIRADLIAQLIANYDSRSRCSYVKDSVRVMVNRADLARALKLPVKKEKGSVNVVDSVDPDSPVWSEESLGFIEEFVSNWVLLHEDTWMMPAEVLNWIRVIKEGHPDKVDWAKLFWFMMEKELSQGENLVDCYYASHFQYLIKSQREDILSIDEPGPEEPAKVGIDVDAKEDEDCGDEGEMKLEGLREDKEDEAVVLEQTNIELTRGQDDGEMEGAKNAELMDVPECKDDEEEEVEDKWLGNGMDYANMHFLQHCTAEEGRSFGEPVEKKAENEFEDLDTEDGEEGHQTEEGFDDVPNDDTFVGNGLTGNLLQAMETTQIAFSSQGELRDHSSPDILASRTDMPHMESDGPSFFLNGNKREITHEHDVSRHGSSKRMKLGNSWDHKQLGYESCMEQIHDMLARASMLYQEKERNESNSSMTQQILISEIQKRDDYIEQLQKAHGEEIQRNNVTIYRLERELDVMVNVLDGYKRALKETSRAFAEYRKQYPHPEEPIYKDAGPGGLVLSTAEIERLRLKREEEHKMNCLFLEQKAKDAEDEYAGQFEKYQDKLNMFDKKLIGLENDVKDLKELRAARTTCCNI